MKETGMTKYILPLILLFCTIGTLAANIIAETKINKVTGEVGILKATAEPALVYGQHKETRQYVTLEVENKGEPQSVYIQIDGIPYEQITLNSGINQIETSVPEPTERKD